MACFLIGILYLFCLFYVASVIRADPPRYHEDVVPPQSPAIPQQSAASPPAFVAKVEHVPSAAPSNRTLLATLRKVRTLPMNKVNEDTLYSVLGVGAGAGLSLLTWKALSSVRKMQPCRNCQDRDETHRPPPRPPVRRPMSHQSSPPKSPLYRPKQSTPMSASKSAPEARSSGFRKTMRRHRGPDARSQDSSPAHEGLFAPSPPLTPYPRGNNNNPYFGGLPTPGFAGPSTPGVQPPSNPMTPGIPLTPGFAPPMTPGGHSMPSTPGLAAEGGKGRRPALRRETPHSSAYRANLSGGEGSSDPQVSSPTPSTQTSPQEGVASLPQVSNCVNCMKRSRSPSPQSSSRLPSRVNHLQQSPGPSSPLATTPPILSAETIRHFREEGEGVSPGQRAEGQEAEHGSESGLLSPDDPWQQRSTPRHKPQALRMPRHKRAVPSVKDIFNRNNWPAEEAPRSPRVATPMASSASASSTSIDMISPGSGRPSPMYGHPTMQESVFAQALMSALPQSTQTTPDVEGETSPLHHTGSSTPEYSDVPSYDRWMYDQQQRQHQSQHRS